MSDINELDVDDIGLQSVMGDRFQDLSKGGDKEKGATVTRKQKSAQRPASKARDAEWEPMQEEVTFLTRLKECTRKVVVFGVLNLLLFYWQQKGLMAQSVALPCMIVCAALAGWGAARLGAER